MHPGGGENVPAHRGTSWVCGSARNPLGVVVKICHGVRAEQMSMRQDSSGEQHRETAFQKAPPERRVQDRHVDVSRPGVRGHC